MVNFRGKGIEIISNDSNRKIDLSWNQAAIRIQQLIEANRYFTPLEAERYAEYISAKTSVPETSVTDMDMPQPVDHISYDYHTGDQVFIGTKQFEILATEPEIVVSDVTFPLFSQRYGKDDFEKKLAENPFNTRLIKNTAEETPEDSQIMKTEPDETENAGVPYTDAFFIDSENQTVTWMYYNPDSTAGGQYVTNTFGFAEISQTAKGSKTSDEFLTGSAVLPIRHLLTSEQIGLKKQKSVFARTGFYRLHRSDNARFGCRCCNPGRNQRYRKSSIYYLRMERTSGL